MSDVFKEQICLIIRLRGAVIDRRFMDIVVGFYLEGKTEPVFISRRDECHGGLRSQWMAPSIALLILASSTSHHWWTESACVGNVDGYVRTGLRNVAVV